MTSIKVSLFTLLSAFLISACNQPAACPTNIFDLSKAQSIITSQTNAFTKAHITRDTAYLNNIFTEDARLMAPGAETVSGHQAIAQVNEEWANYGIYEFEEVSTQFYGNADYLVDEGTYRMVYGEDSVRENGKYVNIWKNINGDWKIYANIWNANPSP